MTNAQVMFPGPGQVEIVEAEMPALGAGQVLIETRRSLISAGTEGASFEGEQWDHPDGPRMPQYPAFPGYSNAGVIVETGEEVSRYRAGDRVTSSAGHLRYAVLSEQHDALWQIPGALSFEEATFCTLGATVLNGVRLGRPQLGDAVAGIGLGVLGQLACQYARLFGARPVIGIDLDDFRLDLAARAGGVTHALNPANVDVLEAVQGLTEGRGADVVYEVTGLTPTYDLAFDLARRFARVVALGSPRWPAPVDMMKLHMKALDLVGGIVSAHPKTNDERNRWNRPANGRLFLDLAAQGAMNVADLVTHRFPYQDAAEAYPTALGQRGPALGVVFQWPERA
jgi:2-desacetyl-2-hydroxyethyl bacteriochlorophyllide A dehydrogenase